jgi:hypothetical protein
MPIDGRSQKSYQTFTGFDTGELRSAHAKHWENGCVGGLNIDNPKFEPIHIYGIRENSRRRLKFSREL